MRHRSESTRRTLGGESVAGFNEDFAYDPIGNRISTPNSSTPTLISMAYDHQGRRRLYVEVTAGVTNRLHRFTYDDYLCIARNREVDAQHGIGSDAFAWDPTEPIATRPLMCNLSGDGTLFYCHDGNKNVSETLMLDGTIAAHYEYSSFGKVVLVTSENEDQSTANLNPYRFSSEYTDGALGLVYYNYRHYDPMGGRWTNRDYLDEDGINLFLVCNNNQIGNFDVLGAFDYFCVCSLTPPYVGTKMGAVKADDGMCGMHNVGTTSKIHVEPGSCNATFDYSWNACFCAKRQCEMRITYRCPLVKYSGGETYQWIVASVEVTSCHSSN